MQSSYDCDKINVLNLAYLSIKGDNHMNSLNNQLCEWINATEWTMEKPKAYGGFHLTFMLVGFAVCLLLAYCYTIFLFFQPSQTLSVGDYRNLVSFLVLP